MKTNQLPTKRYAPEVFNNHDTEVRSVSRVLVTEDKLLILSIALRDYSLNMGTLPFQTRNCKFHGRMEAGRKQPAKF